MWVHPVCIAWRIRRCWRAGEITHTHQMRELILVAIGIAVIAIEMACFRPDRLQRARRPVTRMTAYALALVGHDIVEVLAGTIVTDQGERLYIAGACEQGFGLIGL